MQFDRKSGGSPPLISRESKCCYTLLRKQWKLIFTVPSSSALAQGADLRHAPLIRLRAGRSEYCWSYICRPPDSFQVARKTIAGMLGN
jgi:hypothetical protein